MTQIGDAIRGAHGASALVVDVKDDGLHVVTTRGSAVWPMAEYQECERPPMTLLRSATNKAEALTKEREAVHARVHKQREDHEHRKIKINDRAVESGNSHSIGSHLDTLLIKYGMEGRPRLLTGFLMIRLKVESVSARSVDLVYSAPWGLNNGDVALTATWSHLLQLTSYPQHSQIALPKGRDLKTECPCDDMRATLTPEFISDWHRRNVFGQNRAWQPLSVEEIGLLWVVDRNNPSQGCRHKPAGPLAGFLPNTQ